MLLTNPGMNRAEWIEYAIDKALGKRPRRTLLSRLAKVEAELKGLGEKLAVDSQPSQAFNP